ncbi:MAG: hypothetical protein KDB88_13465 [Flavobacteriales bacterium]|nr:hypothetical protein [Flavobacteriales bacterium]
MTDLNQTLETSVARITRTGPVLVETYFKPDAPVDPAGIMENIALRTRMCQGRAHVMLTVIDGDRELDPQVMRTDFFRLPEDRAVIHAIALVLDGDLLPTVANMYFAYFPQTFKTAVFNNERDARIWLAEAAAGISS